MNRDLVGDVNHNYRTAFVRLATDIPGGETKEFGSLTAVFSALPLPEYNRIFVFDSPTRDEFVESVTWLSDYDVPFRVTVTDSVLDTVEDLATDIGLVQNYVSDPGMVLPSLDEIPPNESGAEISEVTESEELDDFVGVTERVFGIPTDVSEEVYRSSLDGDESRLFIGRVDSQTVACGLLIETRDVAGVYSVCVDEVFRQQGIGEAMTWELLRAGREDGCNVGVLQSSEMAYPLYKKMGFETVVTYHHFEPVN